MHSDPVCTPVTLKTDKRFFPPARCVLGQPCNHVHTAGPDLRPGDDEAGGPARLRRVLGHLRPGQRAVPEPPARDAGRGGRPALAPLRRHRDRPAGAGQASRPAASTLLAIALAWVPLLGCTKDGLVSGPNVPLALLWWRLLLSVLLSNSTCWLAPAGLCRAGQPAGRRRRRPTSRRPTALGWPPSPTGARRSADGTS